MGLGPGAGLALRALMPPITPRLAPLPSAAPVVGPKVTAPAAAPAAAGGTTLREQLERDLFETKPVRTSLPGAGTTVQAQATPPKTAGKPADPLAYERRHIVLNPLVANQTKDEVKSEVDQSFKGKATITGTRTDEEFKAVGNALLEVSSHAWGKETDVAVMINGRERHVTVKLHDDTGKAEATLLPETGAWKPVKTFASQKDAAAALKKDFGIDLMPKGSKQQPEWTSKTKDFSLPDLEKIYDGLSRLSDKEKEAVKGVKLAKVDGMNGPESAAFEDELKADGTRNDVLVFSDRVFSDDKGTFIGDGKNAAPVSMETITHELGHAIETGDLRKAEQVAKQAEVEGAKAMKPEITAYNAAAKKLNVNVTESKDMHDAGKAALSALDDLRRNDDPSKVKELRQAAKDAMAAAKTAATSLPKKEAAAGAAMLARVDSVAKIAEKKAVAVVALDQVDGKDGTQTAKLESFLSMATANNVKPFTDYAATGEQEFFAEGFALYKSDPTYLKENHPKVFEWFEANGK